MAIWALRSHDPPHPPHIRGRSTISEAPQSLRLVDISDRQNPHSLNLSPFLDSFERERESQPARSRHLVSSRSLLRAVVSSRQPCPQKIFGCASDEACLIDQRRALTRFLRFHFTYSPSSLIKADPDERHRAEDKGPWEVTDWGCTLESFCVCVGGGEMKIDRKSVV